MLGGPTTSAATTSKRKQERVKSSLLSKKEALIDSIKDDRQKEGTESSGNSERAEDPGFMTMEEAFKVAYKASLDSGVSSGESQDERFRRERNWPAKLPRRAARRVEEGHQVLRKRVKSSNLN